VQIVEGLLTVVDDAQIHAEHVLLERTTGQFLIARIVLGQQDYRAAGLGSSERHVAFSWIGRVNLKRAPAPGSDSTQISPPWRSTAFLQIARPMPVPSYSLRPCSR